MKFWNNRVRAVAAAGTALVVVAGIGLGVANSSQAASAKYVTATVGTGDVVQTYTATGTISRDNTVAAAFTVDGTVKAVAVSVGDSVDAGDELATLKTGPLKLAVLNAETAVAQAKASLYAAENPTNNEQQVRLGQRLRQRFRRGLGQRDDGHHRPDGAARCSLPDQSRRARRGPEVRAGVRLDPSCSRPDPDSDPDSNSHLNGIVGCDPGRHGDRDPDGHSIGDPDGHPDSCGDHGCGKGNDTGRAGTDHVGLPAEGHRGQRPDQGRAAGLRERKG